MELEFGFCAALHSLAGSLVKEASLGHSSQQRSAADPSPVCVRRRNVDGGEARWGRFLALLASLCVSFSLLLLEGKTVIGP